MAFTKPDIKTDDTRVRRYDSGLVIWIPYAGIVNAADATKLEWWHPLCDVKEVGSLTMSPINEQQLQHVGKGMLTDNDGIRLDPFTISMEADSIEQVAALLGQDLRTHRAIRLGDGDSQYQLDRIGAIQIISADERAGTTTLSSTLVLEVSVQFNQIPGLGTGDNMWEVTFFSEYAEISVAPTGYVHGCEIWYEGGSVVNASAPDGILTTFTLGTGNDSGSVTPTAEVYDSSQGATDIRRWYAAIGTIDSNNQLSKADSATWTSTSTVITPVAPALAVGTKLVAFYVTAVANMPHEAEMDESWRAVNIV